MSRRNLLSTVPAGLTALLVLAVLRLAAPAPFLDLRDAAFDTIQRLHPRPYRPAPVRIIDIDEASLQRIGQWPWPRDVLAHLTQRLTDLGAVAIAFDAVFAEPDRTSPRALAADLTRRGIAFSAPDTLPDNDEAFADALAASPSVAGFALTSSANALMPAPKGGIALLGDDPTSGLTAYPGATNNLPLIESSAAGNGSFSLPADKGRTVRSLPLLARRGETVVPSLSLEALRVAQGADGIALRRNGTGTASLDAASALTVKVGAIEIPLAADGSYPLHFTKPAPERTLPAWTILEANAGLAEDAVKGRIVLIGSSAVGLVDLRATPLDPFEPGVAIHAAALEQIALGDHLVRPIFAPAAEFAAALAAGLGGLALAVLLAPPLGAALLGLLLAAIAAGSFQLFIQSRLILDPVPALLAASVVFAVAILTRIFVSEREKMRLRHAFGHYLAPEMVNEIAAHPERLRLGGETRELTFLFTDLEGFTRFAESAAPDVLVRVLNDYLSQVCAIVTQHGGTIDKIVGDAVHAMFNAPLDQPDHADRAVRAALAISTFAQGFAAARAAEGQAIGATRIGVNTGPAVVGNFGGAGRFDYTAHGDAINTTARLEAANKSLGTRLCIAATTARAASAHRFRPIGTLILRGKSEGVETFEPVADVSRETRDYEAAFSALSGAQPTGAAMLAFAQRHPADMLAHLHAERVRAGILSPLITVA